MTEYATKLRSQIAHALRTLDLWRSEYHNYKDRAALRNYSAALHRAYGKVELALTALGYEEFRPAYDTLFAEMSKLPAYAETEQRGN